MKTLLALATILLIGVTPAIAQGLTAQENRSLMIASQRYADLQREGTPHYEAFHKLLDQAITSKSVVFKDPNWPLVIAEKSRASLSALQQGTRKVGRTGIEKYEDAIAKMLQSDNPKTRQYGQLEQAAHQAELAGDTEKAAQIRAQLAQLQALGRIESLLNSLSNDIWNIKRELRIP
jgi:hypothetical protein